MLPDALAPSSKYRLIRPLGSGGMGTVYLAHDATLKRDVAIKFVALHRLGDAGARDRLVHEAQAAAALDHPAICAVYDVEIQPDGQACIVMQYVEGETLGAKLERGPLGVREALTLVTELAHGLAVAHKRGVIHRDLKPQNIMVTPDGRAKLLDFGIATLADPIAARTGDTETIATTDPAAGTPRYMSPEQIEQRPLDGRSDLFSLGCVFYECLTGRPPFDGKNALEIYGRVVHVHPTAPSRLRPELTPRHDEVCRRLLAKDPSDRFQSADELLGALRVLLPDTASEAALPVAPTTRPWRLAAVAALVVGLVAFGWWRATRPIDLPEAPAEAARWFTHGTAAIREGAYHSAKRALQQALAIHPSYPEAYTRLAEAHIELDEGADAQEALLQANQLADPRRLPEPHRTRNEAIHALVLRDRDSAVRAYRRLVEREPLDAGAWLDLGRVQESVGMVAVGMVADARTSFEKALQLDRQYAAAHLRIAALETREGRRPEALAAFGEAERLYRVASDVEGETEVLLLRGAFLDGLGEVKDARAALEHAHSLAVASGNQFQVVRAELRLSSVTATEGRYEESLKQAGQAVRAAREAGIDTIAAEGLIELGATLMAAGRNDAAEAQLTEALAIARRQEAEGLALRATLNLASLRQTQGRPAEALALAESTLGSLQARRERRKILSALAIMTRSHEDLEQYPRAQQMARQLLSAAEEIRDEPHLALAYESLATQATVFGHLPEALGHRTRVEEIHRRQADASSLPFDLANRADLLIRMGRGEEADTLLREIEEGAARGVDAYIGRKRRVLLLRAVNANITQQFEVARRQAEAVIGRGVPPADATSQLAMALRTFAAIRLGGPRGNRVALTDPTAGSLATRREVRYWQLATALAAGDAQRTLTGVREALQKLPAAPSDDGEWRLAALGAAAAGRIGDHAQAGMLRAKAQGALTRLRAAWKDHAAMYERRPDLTELRTLAGL